MKMPRMVCTLTMVSLAASLYSVSAIMFEPSDEEGRICVAWSELSGHTTATFDDDVVCNLPVGTRQKYYQATRSAYLKRLDEDTRVARNCDAKFNTMPLTLAAQIGDVGLARAILRHGADIDFRGPYPSSTTALQEAIKKEDPTMVRFLLENGADIKAGEEKGFLLPPTAMAVNSGNRAVVKVLLDLGVDPNLGMATLPFSTGKEKRKMADLLLSRGASEDQWAAAALDDMPMLEKMVQKDPTSVNRVDEKGRSPLHAAAVNGAVQAIRLLVSNGANINNRDEEGYTPLHRAIDSNQQEAALLLISLGARTDLGASFQVNTPEEKFFIQPIETASLKAQLKVVKALVDRGERVEGEAGANCVVEAARTCQVEMIRCLLDQGASPNGVERFGTIAERRGGTVEIIDLSGTHQTPLQLVIGNSRYHDYIQYPHSKPSELAYSLFQSDCTQAAALLLGHGASLGVPPGEDPAPLTMASAGYNLPMVRLLLEHGGDPGKKGDDQAICAAASEGSPEILETLLDHGADININCGYGTPLDRVYDTSSFTPGWARKADVLLLRGAKRAKPFTRGDTFELVPPEEAVTVMELVWNEDPEAIMARGSGDPAFIHSFRGDTNPLGLAATHCSAPVVEVLLALGATVNDKDGLTGETPLHDAMRCDVSLARVLIAQGADVNARDKYGGTPLMAASTIPLVNLLLEHGANLNFADDFGITALHRAASAGKPGQVRLFLRRGAEINVQDKDGMTPLHYAAEQWRHPEITRMLLDAGADVKLKDTWGNSAIQKAISSGNQDAVRYLRKKGVHYDLPEMAANNDLAALSAALEKNSELINFIAKGNITLLHIAASYGQDEMVKFLVSRGLDVNAVGGKYQETSLFYAVAAQYETTIKLLLKLGAQIDARNMNGETPLFYSSHNGLTSSCVQLRRAGADEKAVNNKGEKVYSCFPEY